ncbi:MAG: HAMP domain-containing sensor histidine kinase [Actinomycetota bacterium]|nr:HAMP domain-containing sensor histidine kinase [Actinomycetota bacterium]
MRTTAAAVLVVGVALVGGAIALVLTLRQTLTDEVRDAAELRADDLVELLESGTEPEDLRLGDDDDIVVTILNSAGLNSAGLNSTGLNSAGTALAVGGPFDEDDTSKPVFVARTADTEQGELIVRVGRSTEDVDESVAIVAFWLVLGVPFLLLVVGGTTWFVVGRALAPVEAIRAEVDAISGTELHRRVPQPESADEIARLATTMNRMLDRLEESQARQRRFISDASHELRSPVASIRQYAEVALAHPDRVTTSELAESVLADDLRVQHLVDDLLLLTRADEHMLRLASRPVDVDDLVFDEARRLRDSTTLTVDTSAVSAGRVAGDARALARALRNVAANAARHARTSVAFALEEGDGFVTLAVDDDGMGVAEGDRERVFQRFVRLDDARARDEGGSGLGLAIVAELVTAHHGTVVMDESPQGGARLVIRIPVFSPGSG